MMWWLSVSLSGALAAPDVTPWVPTRPWLLEQIEGRQAAISTREALVADLEALRTEATEPEQISDLSVRIYLAEVRLTTDQLRLWKATRWLDLQDEHPDPAASRAALLPELIQARIDLDDEIETARKRALARCTDPRFCHQLTTEVTP